MECTPFQLYSPIIHIYERDLQESEIHFFSEALPQPVTYLSAFAALITK